MRLFSLYLVCLCTVSADILPLLEFKKGIRHDPTGFVLDSWNDKSIDFNGCPSTWNGIVCDKGNVVALALDNLGLSADVDLGVFVNLTMLTKLSMSNNSISGKLPDNLGSFKRLEYFDVSNNLFFSSLPVGIGELGLLKNLSLAGNNFSGPIPDSISGLASIGMLDMSRNALSGPLPLSMTKLEKLVYLNLSLNGFSRRIPKGFELMEKLNVLDLHGNALEGEFDPEFLLLTTASYVDFSSNLLGGKFTMGMSPSVKYLNLSNCRLIGSLVTGGEASAFGSLEVLDLSYNQLSGELPGFHFVYDLQVLRLGNNGFSGSVPNGLLRGGSLVLTELDLSGNNLSGPVSTITSTTLHTFNLSSNMLSGELPPLIGSCAVIDLSRNKFEGNLSKLLKWDSVEVLDLSQNQLTGPIPEATAQFLRLNYLNLSGNSLLGSLPKGITLYPKLMVLDLGFNQLDGPLLSSLLTSSTLKELHLQSNAFSGSIDFPSSSEVLLNLQILDLSNNHFNGYFVDGFGRFRGLQVLNIGGNNLTGNLPASISNIPSLVSLDVSRNHFTGELPSKLSNTLQSFIASYNNLSGVVPENLRRFPLSSFYPGNSGLQFPNPPRGSSNVPSGNSHEKRMKTIFIIVIVIASLVFVVILILLAVIIRYKSKPKDHLSPSVANKDGSGVVISTEDISTSQKRRMTEVTSPDEKTEALTGFSPAKNSSISWSPGSGDSNAQETNLSKLEAGSPDRMVGELNFLDDTISFTSEELSRAPAEVLGRSCHGTSYKATLDNGLLLTVKWLREGVTKQRKEFAKEAKKFANIRHPNVVGLRGYYWGPTKHEKLLLSDYISPGSLATFLYDRPGRKGPLSWAQRLKIAVDTARGLNYLHFDRAIPHGNLKSTNVLLDGPELNAKISDYCLHRLMIQSGTVEQILDAGVLGYRAPELAGSKKPAPSFKSDVYAFGVILLELLTGKCAGDVVSGGDGGVDLTDWVRLRVVEGRGGNCFDGVLMAEMSLPGSEKGMQEVLGVALRCIRSVSERPGIKTVYEDLSSV